MSRPKDYDDACRMLELAQRRNASLASELGACKARRDALAARVERLEGLLAPYRQISRAGAGR